MFTNFTMFMNHLFTQLLALDFLRNLAETAEDFLKGIFDAERFIQWLSNYALDLPYFAQLGGLILGGIVVVMGLFALLKALTKIIIVLGILIIIAVLFQQGVFGSS